MTMTKTKTKTARSAPVAGVDAHRWDMSGGAKTVCTSYVLGWFGIRPESYHYSGTVAQRSGVLRRNGYAVRSRASVFAKARTMGSLPRLIAAYTGDPPGTTYMVRLGYGGNTHAVLLSNQGRVLVDTDPRTSDRRKVLAVHAVFRS